MRLTGPLLLAIGLTLAACGADDDTGAGTVPATPATAGSDSVADQAFPDVIGVEATDDGGSWTFAVTISSPYDTAERYADAWRVLGPDDTEYGIRILAHDHASEQPFTRSQGGIVIPSGVKVVTVQARDLVNGWGGATVDYDLPD